MTPYEKKRKRFLRRVFVGLTLFIFSFGTVSLLRFFLGNILDPSVSTHPLVWIFSVTFIVAMGYQPVDHLYTWLFRQILFPRRSQTLALLSRLLHDLTQTYDLREVANLLVNTLGEVLQLKTVSVLIQSTDSETYKIVSAYGWSLTDYRKVRLSGKNPLVELMKAAGPEVLLRSQATRSLSWQEANELTKDFETLHTTCVVPLWAKSGLVGSLNLLSPNLEERLDEGDIRFLRDFGQGFAQILSHALEIQNLKLINEELRDSQSKLLQSAKLSAIEQLATGIAHEIHNPLTIISGKAQVLLLQKDQKLYDPKVEEVLKTIVQQTRRAADITKKLLMFSQTSALAHEKIRLEAILEDTLSLIAYRTSLEGIEIQRLTAEDLPDFFGNVQELREVFFNLVFNAIQAVEAPARIPGAVTKEGGRIQVGITFERTEKVFVIQVADSGPGIPTENIDKVFNPFFTTRPEGMGLGLFVTQQIVHRYGGSIRVESQTGEGTIFVIELPVDSNAPNGERLSQEPPLEATRKELHNTAIEGE